MEGDTSNLALWALGAASLGAIIFNYLLDRKSKEQKIREAYGEINPAMICPHCQSKGTVRTKMVTQKGGISGTKATAALFTAGVSLLATGLAKKNTVTQALCEACNNVWSF